jgi:hypothetical protein
MTNHIHRLKFIKKVTSDGDGVLVTIRDPDGRMVSLHSKSPKLVKFFTPLTTDYFETLKPIVDAIFDRNKDLT